MSGTEYSASGPYHFVVELASVPSNTCYKVVVEIDRGVEMLASTYSQSSHIALAAAPGFGVRAEDTCLGIDTLNILLVLLDGVLSGCPCDQDGGEAPAYSGHYRFTSLYLT